MQPVDSKDLTYIMFCYREDADAIIDDPPELPFIVDDSAARKNIARTMSTRSLKYDIYRELTMVSMLTSTTGGMDHDVTHVFNCADLEPEESEERADCGLLSFNRVVNIYPSERELVEKVCNLMVSSLDEFDTGEVLGSGKFVGWQLGVTFMPMLVNKALSYGVKAPRSIRSNPFRKYSTVDVAIDLANIYSQGVGYQMRPLPSLGDTLKFWNPEIGTDLRPIHEFSGLVCEDSDKAKSESEKYLLAMKSATERYLNH